MPWTPRSIAVTITAQMTEHRRAIGQRLLELRKGQGWNQEDAAHHVGVAVKTWQNWERGLRAPYDQNASSRGTRWSTSHSGNGCTPVCRYSA